MVVGEVVNASSDVLSEVVVTVGRIGLFLQALGVIVVLWIIFEIIALIVNRKKRKAIYKIKEDIERVEKKVDRIIKNLKNKK